MNWHHITGEYEATLFGWERCGVVRFRLYRQWDGPHPRWIRLWVISVSHFAIGIQWPGWGYKKDGDA